MSTAKATAPPGPILTFLSPCPARSRSAVGFLNQLFHLPLLDAGTSSRRDALDRLHFGDTSSSWDSVACTCPSSGTVLHFLSLSTDDSDEASMEERTHTTTPLTEIPAPLHLIAVQGPQSNASSEKMSDASQEQYRNALLGCRRRLADAIQSKQMFSHPGMAQAEARLRGLALRFMHSVGRQPSPSWILERLLLDLSTAPAGETDSLKEESTDEVSPLNKSDEGTGTLRELAIPFFPGASSLQTDLSRPSLLRPLPGLYQCPMGPSGNNNATTHNATDNHGLILRPLPAAQEDLRLSPPSLVFQSKSLDEAQELIEGTLGGRTSRIGWRGHGQPGSLIVSHPSIFGVDIRICETAGEEWVLSSSFDEAQDSLLAGSLAELQSTHVVSEGKRGGADTVAGDPKIGRADCWIETKETVKRPSGFVSSLFRRKASENRIAKPPDLPYE